MGSTVLYAGPVRTLLTRFSYNRCLIWHDMFMTIRCLTSLDLPNQVVHTQTDAADIVYRIEHTHTKLFFFHESI